MDGVCYIYLVRLKLLGRDNDHTVVVILLVAALADLYTGLTFALTLTVLRVSPPVIRVIIRGLC